jgi:hypothetical protein
MTEYSRLAKGNFVAAGTSAFVNLPFVPDYVELWNYSIIKTPAASSVVRAWWDSKLLDGTNNPTMIEVFNSSSVLTTDSILTNGISSFQAALALQFGPVVQNGGTPVSSFSISKANPAVVTTVGNHGLTSGDVVIFSNLYQTSTTGMQQITNIPFVVTVLSATTFSIPWNTNQSNYTAFNTSTATNNVGSYKQILYPALYAPSLSVISALSLGATTTVSLTVPGNFQVGQEVAFRIPTSWGTTQLNSLPNNVIPGSPVYGFVTAVSTSLTTPTITVSINSTSYTAFNSNPTFTSFVGMKLPQVIPAGDINSGSNLSNFLSPQVWSGNSNATAGSINGPAIAGAFLNNTSQGFFIGAGTGNTVTGANLIANTNIIYWHAYAHDYGNP